MKINKIFPLTAVAAFTLGFSSCIEDDSTYGQPDFIPSISVSTGADEGEVPVVNNYFGSETVIEPTIDYTGDRPLSYEWSVSAAARAAGDFEVVSTEPVFRYTFPTGGQWTVILKITDGIVGFSQEYEISVNRPFEKGYCLISNSAAGVGNLVFLKDMTSEELDEGVEPVVIENVLPLVSSSAIDEPLVGINLLHPSWPFNAKPRLMVSTASRCYYLDPNSFTEVSRIDFRYEIPNFSATNILPASSEIVAFDSNSKRFLSLLSEEMIAFEKSDWKGTKFDNFAIVSYTAWGNTNYDIAYYDVNPLRVYNRGYDYNVGGYLVRPSDEMINDEFISVFGGPSKTVIVQDPYYGDYEDTVYPFYFFTRDKSTGEILWNCYSDFGAYSSGAPVLDARKVVGNASSAIPAVGSTGAPSEKFSRTYYYNGNHVYVLIEGTDGINNLPSTSQWALEYPSDEEVTYIGIDNTSVKNDEILIVATVNTATGRGNLYFYNPRDVRTDNPGAKPSKTYLDCADRISQVFYKPRK
ncbi:MAG: hypothetical protein K2K72_04510 [Duncaniella sp.]|nr:hypothetical protein [Duncaniella sp.]